MYSSERHRQYISVCPRERVKNSSGSCRRRSSERSSRLRKGHRPGDRGSRLHPVPIDRLAKCLTFWTSGLIRDDHSRAEWLWAKDADVLGSGSGVLHRSVVSGLGEVYRRGRGLE